MRDDEPRSPQGPGSADGRTAALDELRQIFGDLNRVTDINDLKPIYYRLESLGQKYSSDTDVQSVLAEVRQRLIAKGQSLMEGGAAPPPDSVVPQPAPVTTKTAESPKVPPAVPAPAPAQSTTRTSPATKPPPATGYDWKKTVILGAVIGMVVFTAGIVIIRKITSKPPPPPPVTEISFRVQTTPAGASIRVRDRAQPRCTSDCMLNLPPGEYQIEAFLDGYEPASRSVALSAGAPGPTVDVQLQAAPQTVRVNADIEQAKAALDDQPSVDLVDGAATFDRVAPGRHTIKVTARGSDATFTFEIVAGKAPVIDAAPVSRNLVAVLISNFQTSARLHSNKGDLKVAVDAQPAGQPSAQGMDLNNLQGGFREITFGEGEDAQKKLINIGPAPMLTAFLMRPAVTTGSLMVVCGEDGATIYINGRDRGKTERGSRRIPNLPLGSYMVRVVKEGYQGEPEKSAVIKKGEETKVEFQLRSLPKLSAITVRGGPAGATLSIDGNQIGVIGADGSFSAGNIQPGGHTVELRRGGAQRSLPKQFRAGETVEITGAEAVLERQPGRLRVSVVPADARVSYRRADEAAGQARPIPSAEFQVPEGTYVISATAPNYAPRTQNVTVASGELKPVDLALTPSKGGGSTTTVTGTGRSPVGMDGWEPGAWTNEGGWEQARSADYLPFKVTPTYGTFEFNVKLVRGGQIKWFLNFTDARNHVMFLLDDNGKLTRRVMVDGRRQDVDYQHGMRTKEFTVKIEVGSNGFIHQLLYGTSFKQVDTWNGAVAPASKFGFYLPGRDQIGLQNFKFTPR